MSSLLVAWDRPAGPRPLAPERFLPPEDSPSPLSIDSPGPPCANGGGLQALAACHQREGFRRSPRPLRRSSHSASRRSGVPAIQRHARLHQPL